MVSLADLISISWKIYVRMAERSKAPDSRDITLSNMEHSGPRMWAWVRIPLLTLLFTDTIFPTFFLLCARVRSLSTEPDLNQRPKDYSQLRLQSSALPTELSVGTSKRMNIVSIIRWWRKREIDHNCLHLFFYIWIVISTWIITLDVLLRSSSYV